MMTVAHLPNLFPVLDRATEAALRESIKRFGAISPVVKDQHDRILDGHHHSRIARELGVEFDMRVMKISDDDEARAISETLKLNAIFAADLQPLADTRNSHHDSHLAEHVDEDFEITATTPGKPSPDTALVFRVVGSAWERPAGGGAAPVGRLQPSRRVRPGSQAR